MRRQRGGVIGRSRGSDEEEGWVGREEEREQRKMEAERERLVGLVQVAKERYERAVEKLGTFTGEPVEVQEEEQEVVVEMAASPTPGVRVEMVYEPSPGETDLPGGSRLQPDLGGGFPRAARAVVNPPDSISDAESQSGRSPSFSPPRMSQNFHSRLDPSPSLAVGITNSFRMFNPFSAYISSNDYNTPSPPSTISADDRDGSYSAPSFSSVPTRQTPLLSLESRNLAEETSAVLELLSRAAEIDMDDDAQRGSIEQVYENIGKLRNEYCVPVADERAVPPPVRDSDCKCVICLEDIAVIVLIPCHHMVMCEVRSALSLCEGVG